jgi:hypothetical protein
VSQPAPAGLAMQPPHVASATHETIEEQQLDLRQSLHALDGTASQTLPFAPADATPWPPAPAASASAEPPASRLDDASAEPPASRLDDASTAVVAASSAPLAASFPGDASWPLEASEEEELPHPITNSAANASKARGARRTTVMLVAAHNMLVGTELRSFPHGG